MDEWNSIATPATLGHLLAGCTLAIADVDRGRAEALAEVARGTAGIAATEVVGSAREAVAGADVVVTDTWVSMGDQDYEARLAAFARAGGAARPCAPFRSGNPSGRTSGG